MEIEITFILNNRVINTKINPATVLLDFIRKNKKLTGTKEVCKEGDCGACAVLLGEKVNDEIKYKSINSCLYPIEKVSGKHVVTIEGLNQIELNPIQEAFATQGASQCGFCTPGFIISATGYLLNTTKFEIDDAVNAIAGNICRCTGYHSIIRSLSKIVDMNENITFNYLIKKKIIPDYFNSISDKIDKLNISEIVSNDNSKNKIQYISGGTDLFVQRPDELLTRNVNLIEKIIEPNIFISDTRINISGSSTVQDLQNFLNSNITTIKLEKLFRLFASLPIRNTATLAGNIINASPIADLTINLLALNAQLKLRNSDGEIRNLPLNKLYLGYKKLNKGENEIIEEISIEIPNSNSHFNFEKVSKRTHLDIATVNTAIHLEIEKDTILTARLSAGGVSPIPLYLEQTSNFLINSMVSEKNLLDSIEIAMKEISPISDIRGTAEYKSLLLSQLIKAHFLELFPKLITSEVLL